MITAMAEPINLELLARHLQAIRTELRDMQFHAENDRRNVRSQIDNLAATHASQLGDVEAKLAARIDALETLVDDRFQYLDDRIGTLDAKVGGLGEKVGGLDEKVGGLDEKVGGLDEKLGRLETQGVQNAQRMDQLIALVEQLVRRG